MALFAANAVIQIVVPWRLGRWQVRRDGDFWGRRNPAIVEAVWSGIVRGVRVGAGGNDHAQDARVTRAGNRIADAEKDLSRSAIGRVIR